MTNTKNAMNFGAILGLSLCVVSAIFMSLGYFKSNFKDIVLSAITIAIISWGTISFRDHHNYGFINYGKAFTSCFLIVFYSSIIFGFFYYIYFNFFGHEIMEEMIEEAENKLFQDKLGEEEIEYNMRAVKYLITPIGLSITSIISSLFMGAIFGLITAAFLKRDNPNFNNFIKENQ